MNQAERTFWNKFIEATGNQQAVLGESWRFGNSEETADELGELVLQGIKTATSSALDAYQKANEPIPTVKENTYDILLDGRGKPIAILKITNVSVITFNQITPEFAYKEGEGDRSLAYWREVHQDFWGADYEEEMGVVCEEFQVVWK
ncbi:ASCH domain-containing protein [Vagococcus zengguangii]|uniref:ASCH domain-containing protein n=1 Tax=Vagococcus zengguangii TaxID=2571750 RepID=A0A4D7CUY9_9ENTE|nr:ASCH domain-containing protein [Vagococcus zengguangii]QCI86922.1 ASCH domain-containing protein [Vagococcus zengguangii]TLG81037.1 ASCH domain-containing protein [Vagococcus zengguangii]